MNLLVTVLVATTALVGCRHRPDGPRTANDPMTPPAYQADGGGAAASEYAPIPRYQAPSQGVPAPAPSVTAQPGDVQL